MTLATEGWNFGTRLASEKWLGKLRAQVIRGNDIAVAIDHNAKDALAVDVATRAVIRELLKVLRELDSANPLLVKKNRDRLYGEHIATATDAGRPSRIATKDPGRYHSAIANEALKALALSLRDEITRIDPSHWMTDQAVLQVIHDDAYAIEMTRLAEREVKSTFSARTKAFGSEPLQQSAIEIAKSHGVKLDGISAPLQTEPEKPGLLDRLANSGKRKQQPPAHPSDFYTVAGEPPKEPKKRVDPDGDGYFELERVYDKTIPIRPPELDDVADVPKNGMGQ